MTQPALQVSPSPDAMPFWEAAQRRELALPWCTSCAAFFFYPRAHCPTCGSRSLDWRRATGRGRIYTFCIHHHSPLAAFSDAVPFVTAVVTLEEGPRMMTLLVGIEPDPAVIACDVPVEVAFVPAAGGTLVPAFRPVKAQP